MLEGERAMLLQSCRVLLQSCRVRLLAPREQVELYYMRLAPLYAPCSTICALLYYMRLALTLALTLGCSRSPRQGKAAPELCAGALLSLFGLLSLSKPPLTHDTDLSYSKNK